MLTITPQHHTNTDSSAPAHTLKQIGTIQTELDEATGRCGVKLDAVQYCHNHARHTAKYVAAQNKIFALKPANLEVVRSPAPPPPLPRPPTPPRIIPTQADVEEYSRMDRQMYEMMTPQAQQECRDINNRAQGRCPVGGGAFTAENPDGKDGKTPGP
jgi:hypothetical protein